MSYDPQSNPYESSTSPYLTPKPGPSGQEQLPLILAIVSVVAGGMGFLSCFCCLFLPMPVLSLATGVPVLFMRSDQTAKIIAIVGVVFAALSIAVFILAMVVWGGAAMTDPQFRQQFNQP